MDNVLTCRPGSLMTLDASLHNDSSANLTLHKTYWANPHGICIGQIPPWFALIQLCLLGKSHNRGCHLPIALKRTQSFSRDSADKANFVRPLVGCSRC